MSQEIRSSHAQPLGGRAQGGLSPFSPGVWKHLLPLSFPRLARSPRSSLGTGVSAQEDLSTALLETPRNPVAQRGYRSLEH